METISGRPAVAPTPAELRRLFYLDPEVTVLNHGSFGACPRPVLAQLRAWHERAERQPVKFYSRDLVELTAEARSRVAAFLNAEPDNLVFVPNPTTGANVVARSLRLAPGDQVLGNDHEYGAVARAWTFVCEKAGATYRSQPVPLPATDQAAVADAIWAGVTERTRVIVLSHITSPTAMIMPVEEICRRARTAGILTLVDGAHAAGQLDVDLAAVGADFYTGNFHKWVCGPKGTGFLYARPELQARIEPLVVSWGWRPPYPSGRTRFQDEQEWQGTRDIAPYLTVPAALDFLREHRWELVRARCRSLAREARERITALTGLPPLTPPDESWFGQMVALPLPPCDARALKAALWDRHRVEIPINEWNGRPLIRVSIQGYNDPSDIDRLLDALTVELPRHAAGA